jgi:hypothetical protein
MKNFNRTSCSYKKLVTIIFLSITFSSIGQTIMFDDFNYSSVDDAQLSAFNKWNVISGVSGPPEGGQYSRNNVAFINDPGNAGNRLMTLSTNVNGSTKAITHARVEAGGFEYFEGTYAARVYLSDVPFRYKDANIQTFYTIVSSALAQDGSKYSELDIVEYMAADKWGISPDNQVIYTTSYHKYIANPWKPWKVYNAYTGSKEGWHTFVASCTDKVNIRYYMDGNLIATHSVTDSETQAGLPVYPRSNMQVAFANWIWNNVAGPSTANRTTTMQVDWTAYFKDQNLSPSQVESQVATYRSQGLLRRNLVGQTVFGTTPPPSTGVATVYKDCDFGGYAVSLATGDYTLAQLNAKGVLNKDISSLRVNAGYELVLYQNDAFTGTSVVFSADDACLVDNNINDWATSVRVRTKTSSFTQTIQAESYGAMGGVQTETTTDVDGGLNVGYIDNTDWMSYHNITIPTTGSYLIEYRVASPNSTGVISMDLNANTTSLGSLAVPNTGGWQNWTTISYTVPINAGTYNFGIYASTGGFNLNWWRISKVSSARSAVTEAVGSNNEYDGLTIYPNPVADHLFISAKSFAGAKIQILSVEGVKQIEALGAEEGINVSKLKPGLYTIVIELNGKKIIEKFIKK